VTVAAVIVSRDGAEARADAAGRTAARRIVEAAWAGGALPIVVVAPDPDGALAAALAGSPARLVPPPGVPEAQGVTAAPGAGRDVDPASMGAGMAAVFDAVAEIDAILCWPAAMTWVDPETVTSLIEAHGVRPGRILRPVSEGRPGWPVLVPAGLLDGLLGHARPGQDGAGLEAALAAAPAGVVERVELGDPGVTHGREVPLDRLPAYAGPSAPLGGPPPEWGAAAADEPD
jgi:CTP:molybdopterin cytidylyltransferase MocA